MATEAGLEPSVALIKGGHFRVASKAFCGLSLPCHSGSPKYKHQQAAP